MENYDIARIAEETGLTPHTLRYYEKEALVPEVPRDAGGRRRYSDRHLRVLKFVNALRATGMPIRQIKRYLALYEEGDSTWQARLDLLEAHRSDVQRQLASVKSNLRIIEAKISSYRSADA
ncbi:MAG: MerR family transcriptional regulator [Pseudomonadales bacterium]|nr:MerR family transcriptional regulator [Pseudomonadales bacterium]